MIAIDTKEKMDWLLNALDNNELILDNRKRTEEEWAEISRELAEYKAKHLEKTKTAEPVLA
jgi:hypothetical protein